MSSVYESIMAGLTEALNDAQNNGDGENLVRHTVELPDNVMILDPEMGSYKKEGERLVAKG